MTDSNISATPDLRYPQFLEAAHNPDLRGTHSKFFGKGPASVALSFDYSIAEVFMTTSKKDVVRGMHFQTPGQPKMIQVITGGLHGNILCCNSELPEFGQVVHYKLNAGEGRILVPGDWALGYRALEEDTRVLYLAGADFVPGGDTGIDPFDKELDLDWGLTDEGVRFSKANAILSDKDLTLPSFRDFVQSLSQD